MQMETASTANLKKKKTFIKENTLFTTYINQQLQTTT